MTNSSGHSQLHWDYHKQAAQAAITEAYALPASKGILKVFESPSSLTAVSIISRILSQQSLFAKRNEKKSAMESEYNKNKTYVQEA